MTTRCFHCAEPLPPDPPMLEFDGAPRAFCCVGCMHAASFIRDNGLADFYRLRSEQGARVAADIDCTIWDRDDLLAEHSRAAADGTREITVLTDGMRCAACAWLIDQVLRREPAVAEVQANAVTGRIRLRWRPHVQPLSLLLSRLATLGYATHLAPDAAFEAGRLRERRQMILRLGVAGIGSLQAMMFAEALYLDFDRTMPDATRDFLRWIAFLVSTPVVFYAGWPFIAGMRRELAAWRHGARRLGMDTLVAGSVLLAYGASLVETLRGGAHVWYDAAVMFVFLLLLARALEQFARRRANAAIEQLARARPAFARRCDDGGRIETVPLAALRIGDRVQVAAGDTVPADGVLLVAGEFDEALLTGEGRPVARIAGERVLAGCQCLGRPVELTVSATGPQTRLSQLVRQVEQAQDTRPPLAEAATAWAGRFVLLLFGIAAVVFAVWWQLAPERAFEVMLAVLVISCPCALALAVPAGLAAAHGALARLGVLALTPAAIDRLATIDTVLLDKTGTLTTGVPSLRSVQLFGAHDAGDVLAVAAALERNSGHPLAKAFAASDRGLAADSVLVVPGYGVAGRVAGREWKIGRAGFAAGREDDGALWLGDGAGAVARFEASDTLRPDAARAIEQLRALGLAVEIASGDAAPAVAAAAARLGIDRWNARLAPEDKRARLATLQQAGHRVGMLGDGINDGPVLAAADASVALADGAPLAHRAADLVIAGTALERLPQAIALARRTRSVLRQNLAWAIGYNVLALPLAAAGLVTPWLAALGMAGSSLLVTANALRLARAQRPAQPSHAGARPLLPAGETP